VGTKEKKTPKLILFVFGLVIGILAAAAFFLVRGDSEKTNSEQAQSETQGIILSITPPINWLVTTEKSLVVKGNTGKESVVAITGGRQDKIVETSSGNFSADIQLRQGENEISVYAFDAASGENVQTSLNILYLEEDLAMGNVLVAASFVQLAENTLENIDKIKEKLSTQSADIKNEALGLPKSHVFGNLVSKSASFLTLNVRGNLKTVFTDDLTKFYSIGKKGKVKTTLAKLLIGDKIAAAGITLEDSVGSAEFIVKMENDSTKRHAVAGRVEEISESNLVLTQPGDQTITLKTKPKTSVTAKGSTKSSFSNIKKGDLIVSTVSLDNKGNLVALSLFVLPKSGSVTPKQATKSATPPSSEK
jgi:hypothetical protein